MQNVENGVVWVVRGHPSLSAMSPFDRAYMISYSFMIETIRLSCPVFEKLRVIRRNSQGFTHRYPTCIRCFLWGDLVGIRRGFWQQKARVPGLS